MADRKISDLTALTTPASGDFLPIVDISEAAAASKNKRITIEELMRGVPDGTAAAPGIAFETDPNTGIYSPGADQLAVSTGGTGRLFITSAGLVGIGTSAPLERLHIDGTGNKALITPVTFGVNQDSAYLIAGSPSYTGTTTNWGTFGFQHRIKSNAGGAGRVTIDTKAGEAFCVTDNNLVGIGTTSPAEILHVNGAANPAINITGTSGSAIIKSSDRDLVYDARFGTHVWRNNGNEQVRIDSSGRLLIGTSTARSDLANLAPRFQVEGSDGSASSLSITYNLNDFAGPSLLLAKSRGTTAGAVTVVQSGDILGGVYFLGTDGTNADRAAQIICVVDGTPGANDMPGRIVLSTTADGSATPTERLRITSTGQVRLAGAGITFNGDTAAANELDDYEEGTWTPAYQTSNSDISITSTTVTHAVYTKIGNRVFCTCRFFSNVASVGTGTARVTGLPFTSASGQEDVSCVVSFAARFITAAPVTATVRSSATQLDLITVYTDTTLGGNVTYMPAANLRAATAGSNIISISFNYIV